MKSIVILLCWKCISAQEFIDLNKNLIRDFVDAARMPGLALQKTFGRKPRAFPSSMFFDCINGVIRAARIETAALAQKWA